jgi:hypothetical protein
MVMSYASSAPSDRCTVVDMPSKVGVSIILFIAYQISLTSILESKSVGGIVSFVIVITIIVISEGR